MPLNFADDGYDLAHNRCIIPRDRGESLIVRKQPYAAAVVMEFLNGGFFVIQQRSNKIARFGSGLGTYDYPVAIQNGSVLHGLTYDLEHIELALAHDVIGERVIGVYVFFRGNGCARCDSPDDGNIAHARRRLRQNLILHRFYGSFAPRLGLFLHGELAKVYRTGLIWIATKETFLLELI